MKTTPLLAVPAVFAVAYAQSAVPTANNPETATTYSVSLLATNPTAVPLSSIVSTQPTLATIPLPSTPTAGSVPTYMSGAPPLPNLATIVPSAYPPLDTPVADINSPEVLQWIQEVKDSGIPIPTFAPTNIGGCDNNSAVGYDPERCYWTCTGCVMPSDITECPDKFTWGLTFDDGPAPYTPQLLNYLDDHQLKATFFVIGSRAISNPGILQAEYMGGHQIGVHTWSHFPMTTLSNEVVIAELGWTKKLIKDVTGVTPNMWRPPYGDIDNRVRAISLAMGLTPVIWTRVNATMTFDTEDFDIHGGLASVQRVLYNWENIMQNVSDRSDGFLTLSHDLFQQAVEVNTGYILPDALARTPKLTIEPVIQCLHKDISEAYIELNNNQTNPPITNLNTSTTIGTKNSSSSASPSSGGNGGNGGSGGSGGNGALDLRASVSSLFVTAVALSFAILL